MQYEKFEHKDKSIFLVNMNQEPDIYFSEILKKGVHKYLRKNKKILVILNKKGYSGGVVCRQCGHIPQCTNCSVSIKYHRLDNGDKIGICHICKTQYSREQTCSECKTNNVVEFGIGIQKVQEYIESEFKTKSLAIYSEIVNSKNKINKIMDLIADYSIIIGTSLLSSYIPEKGINYIDLIIILDADTGLNIPDFSAAKNNFYFIYSILKKHDCKNFIVQTFNPEHYSIRNACRLDTKRFQIEDNKFRKENKYPPFTDMCIILYKNEIEENVFNKVSKLNQELLYLKEKYGIKDLEIYTTPPLIYKIFNKYRYNIILKGPELRIFMDIVFSRLELIKRGFKIDWDAQSIV